MNRLTNIKHYKKTHMKALYGQHGKQSGLNPGVLWPRKEELDHIKQYEKAFCPSLQDLISENKAKKEEALKKRQLREEQVLQGMAKLPEALKNFYNEIERKKREQEEYNRQREARIEEVREILGYRAKPTDERFQLALQQKEEEEAKARKKEARKNRDRASVSEMLMTTENDPYSK